MDNQARQTPADESAPVPPSAEQKIAAIIQTVQSLSPNPIGEDNIVRAVEEVAAAYRASQRQIEQMRQAARNAVKSLTPAI